MSDGLPTERRSLAHKRVMDCVTFRFFEASLQKKPSERRIDSVIQRVGFITCPCLHQIFICIVPINLRGHP